MISIFPFNKLLFHSLYIYTYIYTYICVYMYIYIYILLHKSFLIVPPICLCFCCLYFWSQIQNIITKTNVQVLLSMLPPRSLIVSGITVHFSRSVVFDSLWSHGLLHSRLPYPSLTPGACSNSCPSSWWCHLTISSSVIPFSSQVSHSCL